MRMLLSTSTNTVGSTIPALVDPRRTTAADGDLRPFFLTDLDVALDPVALALGNEWSDLGGRVEGVADLHGRDHFDHGVDDL